MSIDDNIRTGSCLQPQADARKLLGEKTMASTRTTIPRCSGCNVTYSVVDQEWQHAPTCVIARQQHGEPLDEASGEEIEVRTDPMPSADETSEDLVNVILAATRKLGSMALNPRLRLQAETVETNGFDFYIDGFTIGLSGPDKATCTVTRYDGVTILLKRKALTDFLERRFSPGENDGNLTG